MKICDKGIRDALVTTVTSYDIVYKSSDHRSTAKSTVGTNTHKYNTFVNSYTE